MFEFNKSSEYHPLCSCGSNYDFYAYDKKGQLYFYCKNCQYLECQEKKINLINNEDLKQTNGKVRMDLVNRGLAVPLYELGKILTFGLSKGYQEDSWKKVSSVKYEAALERHLNKYYRGILTDEESGESHLSHALANLAFLVYFEKTRGE